MHVDCLSGGRLRLPDGRASGCKILAVWRRIHMRSEENHRRRLITGGRERVRWPWDITSDKSKSEVWQIACKSCLIAAEPELYSQ